MKAPEDWSVGDLHSHLQHAVDLEFWTIPLYLSALYSIQDLDKIAKQDYPVSAKLLASVAVQEMLHLELVCNLSNALGHTPTFKHPDYDDPTRIPFIHPDSNELPDHLTGFKVGIGALDENQLKLFCAIEIPDLPREKPWSEKEAYDSIGELYEALEIGVNHLWDTCFIGAEIARGQVSAFAGYTPKLNVDVGFSQTIADKASALKAIEAIVAQGEGASHQTVPREYEPPKQTDEHDYHSGWFAPALSHYQKLSIVLGNAHHLPAVYPRSIERIDHQKHAQAALNEHFAALLVALGKGFSAENDELTEDFWSLMTQMQGRITAVWRTGAVPSFNIWDGGSER